MTPDVQPTPPTPLPASPCRFLRNKGMYVYTDGSEHGYDSGDATVYWCIKSMKAYGPDDEEVHRDACCNASRACYEAI